MLYPPNNSKIAREFALIQGFLTTEEIRRFHRPCFPPREIDLDVVALAMADFAVQMGQCVLRPPQRRFDPGWSRSFSQTQAIRSVSELSTNSGHIVLIEYSEPQPPMFLNQGMGAYIINWIYPDGPETDCTASISPQSQTHSPSKA